VGKYARQTTVSAVKSKAEIEQILHRYGATEFVYGSRCGEAVIMFAVGTRRIRFNLPLPSVSDPDIAKDRHGYTRADSVRERLAEQAGRSAWRSLALVIKAKLEACDSGITTLDREFLGYMVLPNGDTLADWAGGKLDEFGTHMPPLLPG
jgi:hypothetical protein